MLRVTLGGAVLAGFPENQTSAYIKLRLPDVESGRDVIRTYTIRTHNTDTIDIDFALHEDCGPATLWALNAKAGDTITITGLGPASWCMKGRTGTCWSET